MKRLLSLFLLVSAGAWAQSQVQNVIVACDGAACTAFEQEGFEVMSSLVDAVATAVQRSRDIYGHMTVLVTDNGSPWNVNLTIPADADITLRGLPNDEPFSVVLDGDTNALPVIAIDPSEAATTTTGLLEIDGLTIQGGREGITLFQSSSNPIVYSPVISRCYIRNNVGAGILCEGNSRPLIVNCSIVGNADGVRAAHLPGAQKSIPDILFCSIISNGDRGVFVETGSNARVRNTLVYANGNAPGDGGLVWQSGVGIFPRTGPVAGGTEVTIEGEGLQRQGAQFANTSRVFFGPPPPLSTLTEMNPYTARSPNLIIGDTPPAWRGVPGPVDVYIRRWDIDNAPTGAPPGAEDQFFTRVIANGFIYTANAVPMVVQVIPEHGPTDGGNWVFVEGARFDQDCQVWFDLNNNGVIDSVLDRRSPKVNWLSSGLLHVQVPDPDTSTTGTDLAVHVLARNPAALDSAAPGAPYAYHAADDACGQPDVVQISPNYARDLDGTITPPDGLDWATILGRNFETGCVVQIGGVVCEYGADPGKPDIDAGGTRINGVVIPPAPNGTAGPYDVTVINPCGLYDVLPNGFTYYASGVEAPETVEVNQWRPANFKRFVGTGGAYQADRSFGGNGFDTQLSFTFTHAANTKPTYTALPHQQVEQHESHTQHEIVFRLPHRPLDIDNNFNVPPYFVGIEIANVQDADGDPSGPNSNLKTIATDFFWTIDGALTADTDAVYFEIGSPSNFTISRGTGPNGRDVITMPVHNWRTDMQIFVDGQPAGAPSNVTPDPTTTPLPADFNVTFEVPAPRVNLLGPVDISVALPPGANNEFSTSLYYVAEDAYSYWDGQPPYVRAVVPRVVPETGGVGADRIEIHVLGSNFIGPATNAGIFSNVQLVWISGTEQTLDVRRYASAYEVRSYNEIVFEIDLTTDPLGDGKPASVPRNAGLTVRVQQLDMDPEPPLTGPQVLATSHDLPNALVFTPVASGELQIVYVQRQDTLDRRDGPVGGGTEVYIDVEDLLSTPVPYAGPLPFVRIGGEVATVFAVAGPGGTPDPGPPIGTNAWRIRAFTPPAPQGLPGTYDVRVITTAGAVAVAPRDQWFTYFMDGRPQIDSISPDHVDVNATDTTYLSIVGSNFDDLIEVTFTFTPASGPDRVVLADFYSQSPREIVLAAPAADAFPSGGLEFPNNLARVEVRVRNRGNDTLPQSQMDDLTSDPYDIFYFDYADGAIRPDVPELAFNDVYLNFEDYVNVQPGTGSIAMDPLLEPAPAWLGQLFASLDSGLVSPLRDRAGGFVAQPYTSQDFEADPRPFPTTDPNATQGSGQVGAALSDIGADEINIGGTIPLPTWYWCEVFPNPTPSLPAGRMFITLRLSGFSTSVVLTAFIVPQGVSGADINAAVSNPTLLSQLTISLRPLSGGGGDTIYMTNDEAIDTVVFDDDAPSGPSVNDVIADGHGAVYLLVNGVLYGDDPNDLIEGQATLGRHLLIDTIPPRMDEIAPTILPALATAFIPNHNDSTVASDVVVDALHIYPYPALPTVWRPATVPAPPDDGVVSDTPNAGVGAQIFFNVGSISNNLALGEPPLYVEVASPYEDPPVQDVNGNPILGLDDFTGLTSRQVSGFVPSEPRTNASLVQGSARWVIVQGGNLLTGVTAFRSLATSGSNVGYDPDNPTSTQDANNALLGALWDFEHPGGAGTVAGLPWQTARDNLFHLAVQFRAQDRAG
ncbi:MAG: right-handed parallel beta-helix repeat-containing protein, partial [Candidatus Hydrogenedentes bacterium]|nr:right-handed parallel beta-helix repeat-containing protein [Candidatus Hydrogenedentota bacterium]